MERAATHASASPLFNQGALRFEKRLVSWVVIADPARFDVPQGEGLVEAIPEDRTAMDTTFASASQSIGSTAKPQIRGAWVSGVVVASLAGLGSLQFLPIVVALAIIAAAFVLGLAWMVIPPECDRLAWWQSLLSFVESHGWLARKSPKNRRRVARVRRVPVPRSPS